MRMCLERGAGFSPRTYGDGVAVLANLHVLAAWSRIEGASGPLRLELPWEPPAMMPIHRDALLAQTLEIDAAGAVPVPTAPGLGIPLDARALRRYAERFYSVTPVRFAVASARRAGLVETATFARSPRARRRRAASG